MAPAAGEDRLRHLEAIQFEISSACNLRCVMCPQVVCEGIRARPKRFMPRAMFDKAVDDLLAAGVHVNALYPFWLGESLMHPEFPTLFERLITANFANALFELIEFDTNAHFLDEAMSRHLLAYRRMQVVAPATFPRLYLSLDAATAATYAAIRVGGDFGRVEANIRRFLDLRAGAGTDGLPRVALQMVVQAANAGEVAAFCRLWQARFDRLGLPLEHYYALNKDAFGALAKRGDAVFLRPLYTSPADQPAADANFREAIAAARDELARTGIRLERITTAAEDRLHHGVENRERPERHGVCRYLMTRPLITVDGLVLPCFNDDTCENALGSLADASFAGIWGGARAEELRRRQAAGGGSDRCVARCDGYVPFTEPQPSPDPGFKLRPPA